MNIVALLRPRSKATQGPVGGNSGTSGYGMLGGQYSDAFRLDRVPQPRELIQQLVGIAYGCITINANAVASTPLRLYARTAKGQAPVKKYAKPVPVSTKTLKFLRRQKETAGMTDDGAVIEEIKDHPILKLLDINDSAPLVDNDEYDEDDTRPSMSGYQLFKTTQIYMESIGRAYWFLEFDGSLPVPSKVWLLRSQMVKEVFADDGSGRINYYEYGGPTGVNYDPRQIIRFADPDPYNPYIGSLSPMMAAIEKIRMSRRGDAQINAILENAARPDAVWSPTGGENGGGMLGAVEARRMEVALNQKFREAGNGSIMVSPVPGTLQILGWKPADIVELERAKMLKSEIGFIFGVPDSLIERNPANQAGAKLADFAHAKYAINPRLRSLVSSLRVLLRMYDPTGRLFFAYDNVMPEDEVFQLEQTKSASGTGSITVGEIRQACDLEPFGDERDDKRYIAATMVALDDQGNVPQPAAPPGGAEAPKQLPTVTFGTPIPNAPPGGEGEPTPQKRLVFSEPTYERLARMGIVKYSDDQPRDQDGRFGSGGSVSDAHDYLSGGGSVINLVALPVKLEHAVMGAVKDGAASAISYLKDIWGAGGTGAGLAMAGAIAAGAGVATAITGGLKMIANGGLKLYFISWVAGNKAVEEIARAKDFQNIWKGLSENEISRVKAITAGYDVLACKPIFLGLEHLGMPHLAAASLFVPTASISYIAHAVATNPLAVVKAAGNAVKAVSGKVGHLFKVDPNAAKAFDPVDTNAAVVKLCDAAKAHAGNDWYFAILPECIEYSGEHGGGIGQAIAMADVAINEYPKFPAASVKYSDDQAREPNGEFGSGGGLDAISSSVNDAYNDSIETADAAARQVLENYVTAADSIYEIPGKFQEKYAELYEADPEAEDNASKAYAHAVDGIPDHIAACLPSDLEDDLTDQIHRDGEVKLTGTDVLNESSDVAEAVINHAWNNRDDIEKIEPAEDELKGHWRDQLENRQSLDISSISASIGEDGDAALAAHAIDSEIAKLPKRHAQAISEKRDELIDRLAGYGEVSPDHFKRARFLIAKRLARKYSEDQQRASNGRFGYGAGSESQKIKADNLGKLDSPIAAALKKHGLKKMVAACVPHVGIWKNVHVDGAGGGMNVFASDNNGNILNRNIRADGDGGIYIHNQSFELSGKMKGRGLEIFSAQVDGARAIGASKMTCTAAGAGSAAAGGNKEYNGYYTWPRFGYDAELGPEHIRNLPGEAKSVTHVGNLMETPAGRDAWKKHGSAIDVSFDLSNSSINLERLRSYKKARGK